MLSFPVILVRLILATALGGVIGVERESVRRAAGFRTHILVCCGSALVMLLSLYIYETYRGYTNIDPARLGSQVISGIGFLGAGTILKDGNTIKGLTTAASLWAVACIGLALGAGFLVGGVITTIIVLIALRLFSRVEILIPNQSNSVRLQFHLDNTPGQIGKVTEALGKQNISIVQISLEMDAEDSRYAILTLMGRAVKPLSQGELLSCLGKLDGVNEVKIL